MRTTLLALSISLAAAGCGKLTVENYSKLKVGMTYSEVTSILGSPTSCDDAAGFRSCRWGDDKRHATLRFAGDKLILHTAENLR